MGVRAAMPSSVRRAASIASSDGTALSGTASAWTARAASVVSPSTASVTSRNGRHVLRLRLRVVLVPAAPALLLAGDVAGPRRRLALPCPARDVPHGGVRRRRDRHREHGARDPG